MDDTAEPTSSVNRVMIHTAWWHTKVQWGVVGAFLVGAGSFVTWSLNKLDVVNVAMAQTQVTTTSTVDRTKGLEQRIEAIDAGTRQAIERLEKKLDASEERSQKKLDEVQVMLQVVLKEVRRR